MARARKLSQWLLMGLMVAVLSCTDATPFEPEVPPAPEPEAGLIGDLLGATGLLQCRPMGTFRATEVIGWRGGTIRVGPHTLDIPRGALRQTVRITATAPNGRVNVIEFEPHGLEFRRPAQLSMSYANCGLVGWLLPKHIAYVDGGLDILELLRGLTNPWRRTITTRLDHFSGYAVAW